VIVMTNRVGASANVHDLAQHLIPAFGDWYIDRGRGAHAKVIALAGITRAPSVAARKAS